MQSRPLPQWPDEVLREWLHRHWNQMEDYGYLCFERFRFEKVACDLDRIPGREAFRDERFCDSFQNVEVRAAEFSGDWLAHYMMKAGTWNTPIVLLNTPASLVIEGEILNQEPAHRRLESSAGGGPGPTGQGN